ncbi:hypothetical protein BU23DRAFT_33358 [Bimuria novae-zelandiae CBS 107.79]|uniref:Uncharacterized protein n=1 Tax=Bimuria novae-zelandiae CBS 107.79 TaxID=1447943 RepID=A0A6A5UW97_9PLEO|nr:hypothetical protein BU23DRAFT_33358 [Bimuria novae-zelandiae CBS 107.79]
MRLRNIDAAYSVTSRAFPSQSTQPTPPSHLPAFHTSHPSKTTYQTFPRNAATIPPKCMHALHKGPYRPLPTAFSHAVGTHCICTPRTNTAQPPSTRRTAAQARVPSSYTLQRLTNGDENRETGWLFARGMSR